MPRAARIKGISGNYHVVLRGINKQRIFEDKQDYEKYFWILKDQQKQCNFALFAWCLMPNHIHLLIKEKTTPMSRIFQGVGSRFVYWYNTKYKRTGPLFEGRYRSEPVDDESYFLKVVRYIHLNPVKAGICNIPEEYPYSSYSYYFNSPNFPDSYLLFNLMEKKDLEQFHKEVSDDVCLDIDELSQNKLTDEQAVHLFHELTGYQQISTTQSLPEAERKHVLQILLKSGASVRQINRLTGVTIRVIEKINEEI